MSGIGPELPPHILAKRKRQQEEGVENEGSTPSGAKRSPSAEGQEKRRKVLGPAMPPAPLEELPVEKLDDSDEESEESEDDGYGPALPSADNGDTNTNGERYDKPTSNDQDKEDGPQQPQRDEWMMMPPKQDDLAARMDPTKQRPKAFNTGKGARGPNTSGSENTAWHETPEQKQKRLADEMMGVAKPSHMDNDHRERKGKGKGNEESGTTRRGEAPTGKSRGPSLLEQHQRRKDVEVEDDPSKRAFDREKDMSGGHISSMQRKQMLNKASDFSSRFSGGGLL